MRAFLFVLGCLVALPLARGYVVRTDDSDVYVIKWQSSPVAFQVKLSQTANLLDGTSLTTSFDAALQAWNAQLGTLRMTAQHSSVSTYAPGNDINEVAMDSTMGGDAFGSGVLAVTLTYLAGDSTTETDIVFNTAYTWNSYRGNLRNNVEDFRRVATHELGHVVGLLHPDEAGQYVTALMNSHESDVDGLQSDDIAGGQKLYGTVGFVPANDRFANAGVFALSGGMATAAGANIAATRETGEPDHAGVPQGHSVWWNWTSPGVGDVTLDTLGSDFDTVLAVYRGTAVSSLTEVVSNDDQETRDDNPTPQRKRTSKVSFEAAADTTYYLAVDGWGDADQPGGSYTGTIVLNGKFVRSLPPAITSATTASVKVGELFSYQLVATGSPTSLGATNLPAGLSFDAATGAISGRVTATGTYAIQLSATNRIATATATLTLTVLAAPPAIVSQPTGLQVAAPGGAVSWNIEATSANGAMSYQWKHDGRSIPGATSAQLALNNLTMTDSGCYQLSLTNSAGTSTALVFLRVAPRRTEIVGWGNNSSGMTTAPAGLSTAVDMDIGWDSAIALKRDGTVVQWGYTSIAGTMPADLTDVVSVAVGRMGVLALKADGTVVGTGWFASVPAGLRNVIAIGCESQDAFALGADGQVTTWGPYNDGASARADLTNVVQLSGGDYHVIGLKADGTVTGWGHYGTGGDFSGPGGPGPFGMVAGGMGHSMALKTDGTVTAWGYNSDGEATAPTGLEGVVAIAAGNYHSVALKSDGTVVAWGETGYGASTVPTGLRNIIAIRAGGHATLALRDASGDPVPDYAGSYFGTFTGNSGNWAMRVESGGKATFISYLPDRSASQASLTIADDGSFSDLPTTGIGSGFGLSGQIVRGVVSGQSETNGGKFSGAIDASGGVLPAGYYHALAIGDDAGEIHAIMASSGKIFVVALAGSGLESFSGTVGNDGQFNATSQKGTRLSVKINATVQSIAATVTSPDVNGVISFGGLRDGVLSTTRAVNIATRAYCSTDNKVTIGGFVVSGSVNKRVLVRAVGPTLTSQGIGAGEVLLDPMIEVHDAIHGNSIVATNDNWGDATNAAEITSTAATVGASALLSSDTKSSAMVLTLAPGVYSFIVKGKDNASGIVLLEVYDADAAATGTNFSNIATRAQATTGNGVTIGGFVVSGNAPKRVLLRAVGPTLAKQGLNVAEVLADPQIELHDAINGNAKIAENDDWRTNANADSITTTGARIGAAPLDASDTKSAALLVTLQPGVYSFIASGKSTAPSGIVLVEVYDAD